MQNCLKTALSLVVALVLGPIAAQAQQAPPPPRPLPPAVNTASDLTPAQSSAPSQSSAPAPKAVTYKTDVAPRQEVTTGYSIGVFGGMNGFQSADKLTINGAPGSYKSSPGGVVGLKLGYTWPFDGEPIDQFDDVFTKDGLHLGAGIDLDMFWSGIWYSNAFNTTGLNADLQTANFMLNPLIKFKTGRYVFSVGPSAGMAYATLSADGGDQDKTVFAYGAVGELEVFVNKRISIIGDYRYMQYDGLNFKTINFRDLQQHIFTVGVKSYF